MKIIMYYKVKKKMWKKLVLGFHSDKVVNHTALVFCYS